MRAAPAVHVRLDRSYGPTHPRPLPTSPQVLPSAAQSTQIIGEEPHASSAVPGKHVPSWRQQPPHDLKSHGDQHARPLT
jgi:hypothetical protein